MLMMKKNLEAWMGEYAGSHQNETNRRIHKICVPLIMWSVMALAYSTPTVEIGGADFGFFQILILFSTIFYFRLGKNVGMAMLAQTGFFFFTILLIEKTGLLWQIALAIFVVCWLFQFYGHKVEGKKPSFFKDLQFLLIGPLWVLRYLQVI